MQTKVPQINTNDTEVEIVNWLCEQGSYIEKGSDIVELGTAKAVVTLQAEHSGFVCLHYKKGRFAKVGQVLVSFFKTETEAAAGNLGIDDKSVVNNQESVVLQKSGFGTYGFVKFTDQALKYISENKIDAKQFDGMGLLTEKHIKEILFPKQPVNTHTTFSTHQITKIDSSKYKTEPISSLKKAEIQSLSIGVEGGIQSTLHFKFLSKNLRRKIDANNLFDGFILPVVLFEISKLASSHPKINAFFNQDEICFYDKVNIGLAIDQGKGLKVVNIENADKKLPQDIYNSIVDLSAKYLENTLAQNDLIGTTLTVTDLSGLNVERFVPIINGKQSLIIGIGAQSDEQGSPMYFSVTFDHRVLSGKEVALFMQQLLQNLNSYAVPVAPTQELTIKTDFCCSRCGIDNQEYHQQYGKFAQMQVVMNYENQIKLICHVCAQGLS